MYITITDGAIVPISTFRALFGRRTLSNFVVKGNDPTSNEALKRRLYEVLGGKMRLHTASAPMARDRTMVLSEINSRAAAPCSA